MALSAGSRVGPYEVSSAIGAGGMGEVWRARDGRLNRDVAIKILPAKLAGDSQYMTRFEREAQVLASLNHPNIASLYGLEDSGSGPALIMELVDGETLLERIQRGPVPVPEAIDISRQICDALEAAHARGIIHRDLKPANIKITPGGQVKVLDFGLAKALEGESAASATATANSPTLTIAATRAGVILGTAAYMSPEQARGLPADKSSDIWAFGVVVYEMLTGRITFAGDTVADTLAAVLKTDPDFGAVPDDTPPSIRRLLRRCLQRDRKRRLRDIADARLELEAEDEPQAIRSVAATKPRARWLPWGLAAAAVISLAAVVGAFAWRQEPPAPSHPARFHLLPPEGTQFTTAGHNVSPDGRLLLIHALPSGSRSNHLYLRALNSPAYRMLPETAGAGQAEFSPDSRSIVFSADSRIRRLDLQTGFATTLCAADTSLRGLAWNAGGAILIGSNRGPVQRVPASGGNPSPVTKLDTSAQETGHGFPGFLPGGRFFLYTSFSPRGAHAMVADLEGKEAPKRLFPLSGGETVFAAEPGLSRGIILYRSGSAVSGVGFDARRRVLTSESFPVADSAAPAQLGMLPVFVSTPGRVMLWNSGVAATGSLELVLLDRSGKQLATLSSGTEPSWSHMEFSPDDRHLLGDRELTEGARDLWKLDMVRNVASRVTLDPGTESAAVFSHDGSRIFYSGPGGIYSIPADGTGTPRLLHSGSFHHLGVSPDGKHLAFEAGSAGNANEIGILSLERPEKREILIGGGFVKSWPQFSPDGKWLAYGSNESGRSEIYVQSHPPGGGKWQVSRTGGTQARWRRDGKELVYREAGGSFTSVEVRERGGKLEFGSPVTLFEAKTQAAGPRGYFAMTSDAQRFAVVVRPESEAKAQTPLNQPLVVDLDWMAELRR